MSASEQRPGEREEWAQLDADDRASAVEERLEPDQAYERYDGPLGLDDWQAERRRSDALERLGIERPELPEPYGQTLGVERAAGLERQVEDRLMDLANSPLSREELSAQARQYGAAARPLDLELTKQVVELEDRRAALLERLGEADLDGIDQSSAGEMLEWVEHELDALATSDGHPDRWAEHHGKPFVEAVAARQLFRREREVARTASAQASQERGAGQEPHAAALETQDTGMDPF